MSRLLGGPASDEFDQLIHPAGPPSAQLPGSGTGAGAANRKKLALTVALLVLIGGFGSLGSWAAWVVADNKLGEHLHHVDRAARGQPGR